MPAVSVLVRCTTPATAGTTVLTGLASLTGPTLTEKAETAASTLVPVTLTRMSASVSAGASRYVGLVAPAMSAKPDPVSRCHW